METSIAVIGAGSWGTALAISLAQVGHAVSLWARRPEAAHALATERVNQVYLPGAVLPPTIDVTADLGAATAGKGLWVIAVPSHAVRDVARDLVPYAHPGLMVVSVAKGIENETLMTTTAVLADVLPQPAPARIGVLYGPSHAEEVAEGMPTTVVASAPSLEVAEAVQDLFMSPSMRVYVNPDLVGVEIAGSVKNVMAIAAGISDGVGYGDNAKAAIVTRGIAEIKRLGLAMGAHETTFSGLAGIGDLVVTCMSRHSRNRYVGEQLGQGRRLEDIIDEMDMVAEGVRTTRSVSALAKTYQIEMPITEAVFAILFEGTTPQKAVFDLMTRTAKHENWFSAIEEEGAT